MTTFPDGGPGDDRGGDRGDGARVAIVMRTRDRPILLARALASVLAQRHPRWHLFLVNDGGDPEPVDALVRQHDTGFSGRISVLHRPESGGPELAAAAGLSLCETAGGFDHLAVHDDDDSWHPLFLERTTAWLVDPANRAFVAVITRWTVVHEQLDRAGVMEQRREAVPFEDAVLRYDALLGRPRFPSICLLRRCAAVAPAGGEDAGGEWDDVLRIIATGDIGVLPDLLACSHRRDAGTLPAYANASDDALLRLALFRNAGLRALGRTHPAALSVVGVLGAQAEQQHEHAEQRRDLVLANLDRNGLWGHARHEDLQHRLIRVEETLARIEQRLAERPTQPQLPPGPQPGPPPGRRPAARLAARLARRLFPRAD